MMAILGEGMAAAGAGAVLVAGAGACFISLEEEDALGLSSSNAALVFLVGKHIH